MGQLDDVDDDELLELVDAPLEGAVAGVAAGVDELPLSLDPEVDVDVDVDAVELPLSVDDDPDGVVLDEPPRLSVL
jgi:hypothetical protein